MRRKKQPNRAVSLEDTTFNRRVSSDRIVVKIYFGRMGQLWTVVSNKYRWSEGTYDFIFRTCLALTNMHVRKNPLRASDHQFLRLFVIVCTVLGKIQSRKGSASGSDADSAVNSAWICGFSV